MPVATARELKQVLFDAYDGFADKRLRAIERDAPFIVDDRGDGDLDARRQLFLWFCQMFATVRDVDRVHLQLRGGIPVSEAVQAWFDGYGAVEEAGGIGFEITPASLGELEDLAARMEAIIRGRYDTKAYKYVVPRTARSLRRLAATLQAAWT